LNVSVSSRSRRHGSWVSSRSRFRRSRLGLGSEGLVHIPAIPRHKQHLEGLPCRGDSTGSEGRDTLGPPDPETTLRQHPRINSFVNEELGRDMVQVTRALHQGSSSAQLRPREKRHTRRTAEDKDIETIGAQENEACDDDAATATDKSAAANTNTEYNIIYTTEARDGARSPVSERSSTSWSQRFFTLSAEKPRK